MIEPQNTVFPVPADAPPVAEGDGDGTAFGDMLAQLVATATQVDSAAISAIATESGQQQNMLGEDAEQESDALNEQVAPARPVVVRPDAPAVPGVDPKAAVVPVAGDEQNAAPIRTLPEPPSEPLPAGNFRQPVADDGIWKPSLTGYREAAPTGGNQAQVAEPPGSIAPPMLTAEPAVPTADPSGSVPNPNAEPAVPTSSNVEPMPQPTPTPEPGANMPPLPPAASEVDQPLQIEPQSRPVDTATTPQPASVEAQPAPEQVAPAVAQVAVESAPKEATSTTTPVSSKPDRRPPLAPAHTSFANQVATSIVGATPGGGSAETARVELGAAQNVRVEAGQPVPVADNAKVGFEPVRLGSDAVDVKPATAFVIPASGSGSTPVEVGGHVAQPAIVQSSALAERVMRAVDLQRTQPPPRSMVVDIPEVEGLRLVVSVRSNGQVTVAPAAGSTDAAFAPFADDLSRVLEDRGFVMNGDDRRRGHNQQASEDDIPTPVRRPSFQRARTDNDLRI